MYLRDKTYTEENTLDEDARSVPLPRLVFMLFRYVCKYIRTCVNGDFFFFVRIYTFRLRTTHQSM